ncbi:hypothetical protein RB195_015458 [Necator americanus]|uniref:Uncharacterized protein n=1 Tax=Necator americanus TaxID=51031 RepID=A0ABR1E4P0_NECAM
MERGCRWFALGEIVASYSCVKTTSNTDSSVRGYARNGEVETAAGIEVGSWRTAEMGGGREDPCTIPTATLHREASSAAAFATVRASCRFDATMHA